MLVGLFGWSTTLGLRHNPMRGGNLGQWAKAESAIWHDWEKAM